MKTSYTLALALFTAALSFTALSAQTVSSAKPGDVILHLSDIGLSRWNGLKVGADYVLTSKLTETGKAGKPSKTFVKSRLVTLNYAYFYRNFNEPNRMFTAGYQFHKMNEKGWFTTLEPMLGVQRSFGTEGENSNLPGLINRNGTRNLITGISFGVGKDFSTAKRPLPITVYTKYSLFNKFPRYRILNANSMVEIGVSYNLGNLFSAGKK
ncbi:MAG: hypothetical protein MUC87_13690 [Bacteroidia bacterium]|jgi:hypothetical protein|nr:hypothetical protein [Bacteroidia bacterium]